MKILLLWALVLPVAPARDHVRPRVLVSFRFEEARFASFYRDDEDPVTNLTEREGVEQRIAQALAAQLGRSFGYLDFVSEGTGAYRLSIRLTSDPPPYEGSTLIRTYFTLSLSRSPEAEAGVPALDSSVLHPREITFREKDEYVRTGTNADSLWREIVWTFHRRLEEKRTDLVAEYFSYVPLGKTLYLHVERDSCVGVLPFTFCQVQAEQLTEFMVETENAIQHVFHGTQSAVSLPNKIPGLPRSFLDCILVNEDEKAIRPRHHHTTMRGLSSVSREIAVDGIYVVRFFPHLEEGDGCKPSDIQP